MTEYPNNNLMFLLKSNYFNTNFSGYYIPAGTEKTKGTACFIIQNVGIWIGEDRASEKAVKGLESVYKIIQKLKIPDDLAELIIAKNELINKEKEITSRFDY